MYYTSFTDSRIALYDGVSSWNVYSLPKDTIGANCSATSLILQDGIYVKSGATTKRYLGTFYTTTATTTEDSKLRRFVWNAQNRASRKLYRPESTTNWSYTSPTWRSANNNSAKQVQVVVGLAIDRLSIMVNAFGFINGGSGGANCPSAGLLNEQGPVAPPPTNRSNRAFPSSPEFAWILMNI